MSKNETFFSVQQLQSAVKTRIVTKYFNAWSKVVRRQAQNRGIPLAYIDLYAGKGRYEDGSKSTPLLILEEVINDEYLKNNLITRFNDIKPDHVDVLREEISSLPGIDNLKYKPKITCSEVNQELADEMRGLRFPPSLFFIDPCGYKGLSVDLIYASLKNWGCDCIFFFNYNRVNSGLNNESVESHLNALFGIKKAEILRDKLSELDSPSEREEIIIDTLENVLKECGANYSIKYHFPMKKGDRTSHYLVFASKNEVGYKIMNSIMAKESPKDPMGVPKFSLNRRRENQLELFSPLLDLKRELTEMFSGQTLTMQQIYLKHSVKSDIDFYDRNYKDALLELEGEGVIITDPPQDERRKDSFGDEVKVTFPKLNPNESHHG